MHELKNAEESLVNPTNVHLAEGFVKPKEKPKGVTRTRKRRQ